MVCKVINLLRSEKLFEVFDFAQGSFRNLWNRCRIFFITYIPSAFDSEMLKAVNVGANFGKLCKTCPHPEEVFF